MTAVEKIQIDHVARLGILLQKPKRVKLLVGGRASTKSTFVADAVLSKVAGGQSWCCGREYQNSIDDSVHSLLQDEIDRTGMLGFDVRASTIEHSTGGHIFYRGLARNITSLKGIHCHGLWIEEGESTSSDTLRVLTASIRVSAKDQQIARIAGKQINIPEIWITMNRGSSKDPIAQKFLKRAERELERTGFYEDDYIMVIDINYDENPWFLGSGLEQERLDDLKTSTTAEYEHKWLGKYNDTVIDAIIEPDWFDACIDAHIKLGFAAEGVEVVSHDAFDGGSDAAALSYRHGSVFEEVEESREGRVNDGCKWALDYAISVQADEFTWDGDGIGAGLVEQVSRSLKGKKMGYSMFNGGLGVRNPETIYKPVGSDVRKPKTNKETFFNLRSQSIWKVRDRIFKTYLAVTENIYTDPGEMISFSSNIKQLDILRSEACRLPKVPNGQGKIQIMSKKDMKKLGIDSPNLFDTVMMSIAYEPAPKKSKPKPQQAAKNYY